jgi:hypothetical protein
MIQTVNLKRSDFNIRKYHSFGVLVDGMVDLIGEQNLSGLWGLKTTQGGKFTLLRGKEWTIEAGTEKTARRAALELKILINNKYPDFLESIYNIDEPLGDRVRDFWIDTIGAMHYSE